MNVALWIAAGVLAAVFAAAGIFKLANSRSRIIESGLGWAEGYSDGMVKLIGTAEVLGAIGLVVPALVDVAPVLVPVAAAGLIVVMVGAAITHARRGEVQMIVANVILLAVAAFVVWGRFGPHAF